LRLITRVRVGSCLGLALASLPLVTRAAGPTAGQQAGVAVDTLWVILAAALVLFMQAGFAMLEVGFTRMKNVGTVVAKIVVNLSISSIMWWAVGFGLAFGAGSGSLGHLIGGGAGFFPSFLPGSTLDLPALQASDVPAAAKFFFEFVFCAISLAIVWGTMLERTKFIVYILFAIPFAGLIYPLISHWVWGGGWLGANLGVRGWSTSPAPAPVSPGCSSSARASASTVQIASPTRSPATTCPWPSSASSSSGSAGWALTRVPPFRLSTCTSPTS